MKRLAHFLAVEVWELRLDELPWFGRLPVRLLRVFLLAVGGFAREQCQFKASALTFYSLLSVVPLLAMAIAIAKGFGFGAAFQEQLRTYQGWQDDVGALIIRFAYSYLEQARSGVIAGIGVVVLFWAVVSVLGTIEKSFNDIWHVREARSLPRKFTDYLSMMLLGTVLLVLSSGVTVLLSGGAAFLERNVPFLSSLGPALLFLARFFPYLIVWLLFTFVYLFMPNTKVPVLSGLAGGIAAGTMFQIVQWAYVEFQIGVSRYGAIYGGFAALPLFLVWLQMSWMIVLFGAEVSYVSGNPETYGFHPDYRALSPLFRKLLMVRIVRLIVQRFVAGGEPPGPGELSRILAIPFPLVNAFLRELGRANLIVEVVGKEGGESPAYQPACDAEKFTLYFVLRAIEESGTNPLPLLASDEAKAVLAGVRQFDRCLRDSPANRHLKDR